MVDLGWAASMERNLDRSRRVWANCSRWGCRQYGGIDEKIHSSGGVTHSSMEVMIRIPGKVKKGRKYWQFY